MDKQQSELDFEYKSNENYPWEYEGDNEVWVADLDSLKKDKPVETKVEEEIELDPSTSSGESTQLEIDSAIESTETDPSASSGEEIAEPEITKKIPTQESKESIEEIYEQSIYERAPKVVSPVKVPQKFSWILAGAILLLIIIGGEIAWRSLGENFFWSEIQTSIFIWLWRLLLLLVWLWLAFKKWRLDKEQVFATAVSAFILGVIISAIWKIFVIKSLWTWLNLLTEPIWMVLMIAFIGALFIKVFKK